MVQPAIKTPVASGGMGWSVIGKEEIEAVTQLLQTPNKLFRYRGNEETQSSLLEKEVQEKLGAGHALFVNSGTSALMCALAAWEIGPGDEVIVPAYTYIATAAAVVAVGAVPVIVEVDESLGLDPAAVALAITAHTKAIIAVHMNGVPCRIDALRTLAKARGLVFIEDCCQAIGANYRGRPVGVDSDAFAWSLNFYKILTCGEGGMFFANNSEAFTRGTDYSDPGMPLWSTPLSTKNVPAIIGGGFRGNEINAAIMRVQLKKLDGMLAHTRHLKALFLRNLEPSKNYQPQFVDDPEGDCGISFTAIAADKDRAKKLSGLLLEQGLKAGSVYNEGFPDRHIYKNWDSILNKTGTTSKGYPWADPAYQGSVQYSVDQCPQTLDLLARSLRIGFHMGLTEQNVLEMADAFNQADRHLG